MLLDILRHLLLLLLEHLVEYWHDPILKLAVVVVGDEEVADAVDALVAEGSPCETKVMLSISLIRERKCPMFN